MPLVGSLEPHIAGAGGAKSSARIFPAISDRSDPACQRVVALHQTGVVHQDEQPDAAENDRPLAGKLRRDALGVRKDTGVWKPRLLVSG